jgi:TolB protein
MMPTANQTQLTNHRAFDGFPAWSPDGQRIMFISERDGNDEIYVLDTEDFSIQRLTENQERDIAAAWQPID